MAKRIFLFPGFGENAEAYDPLIPYLKGYEIKYVDYRKVLSQIPFFNINGFEIAKVIIQHYGIQPEDKLVGHSTGGYFSFLIREIIGNEICMIAGFSDCAKVVHPFSHSWLTTPLLSITGFTKSVYARKYMLDKVKGKPIAAPMERAMLQMKDFNNIELFKISMVLALDEKPISPLPSPLRIHSKTDKLVRLPDEPYVEVEGGHFPMDLDIHGVVKAMQDFLA
ncbi:MAG: alpha/beta hydrolase [Chitinophagales bacterium]|nr:alpha/beta hydrolase [Chitinophagales bacterium]MCZ2394589.1 alpha/beta hydrolase [Chitinophagales bacterium]